MADQWTHPELGEFEFDYECWAGSAKIPGLSFFPSSEEEEDDEPDIASGEIRLEFWIDPYAELEEGQDDLPPSDEQIAAAIAFLNHAEQLAPQILDALWADIQGTGPDSGMWWHGNLEELNENGMFEEIGEQPITDRESLKQSLAVSRVVVGSDSDPGLVEVVFSAEWEAEHGVGVLVKGNQVIGLGYAGEADLFTA